LTFGAIPDKLIYSLGEELHESENERVFVKALCLAQPVDFFIGMTQLMNTRCLSLILAAIFLAAVLPSVANATLAADGTAIISDSFPLNYPTDPEFYAHIDYAVYAPGIYSNSYLFTGKYVYCYQLFDDLGSTSSIMSLDINIDLDARVGLITYDTASPSGVAGGINPLFCGYDPGQVRYGFSSDNPVTVGQHSSVLLFTSDFAPDSIMGTGLLGTTTSGSYLVQLPVPAPEPASVLLLALVAPALLRIRRQNRR
jgi:hypothetical protein